MPITTTVVAEGGPRTVGDYLRAVHGGSGEPVDLVVVHVGADGEVTGGADLDGLLDVSTEEVVDAYQLTGKPGQVAQVLAKVGDQAIRVAFLGVGDRSAAALRRAGAELGRLLRAGDVAMAPVPVAREPDDAPAEFTQGILLGSYRYTEKSDDEPSQGARVRLLTSSGTAGSSGPSGSGPSGPGPSGSGVSPEDRAPEDRVPDGTVSPRVATAGGSGGSSPRVATAGGSGPSGSGVSPEGTVSPRVATAVEEATAIATAVALARDLSNTPSVRKCPQWMAEAAEAVTASPGSGLGLRVWAEGELTDAGFCGILAVGSGSARPPRLIELSYAPHGAQRHLVLVGKGITFDSGGLSLKPNDGMKAMKTDMAGGAAVIAAMSALARLGVTHRVTGLVAAAENMPSGSAYRPGDVITQFGGRTVEVLNTDAEGRIVLADALAYADAELAPDAIVDLATLTGAARIALGRTYGALYATSDELAAALLAAGEASGDRLWRMPLVDEYVSVLESPVADLANVPREDGQPGSITAALFLRGFAGPRPWAHLDIAGAARATADDGEITAGATGFGTRLLLRWLTS